MDCQPPSCEDTTASSGCPQGELDELEREEFFRLKKVQKKKKKDEELRMEQAAAQVPVFADARACCASNCVFVLL